MATKEMQGKGGLDYDMFDNKSILKIDSPNDNVDGVHVVLYADPNRETGGKPGRYAVVALNWRGEPGGESGPGLGIRWFWGRMGCPVSSSYPVWLVVPDKFQEGVVNALFDDNDPLKSDVNRFLAGGMTGEELAIRHPDRAA